MLLVLILCAELVADKKLDYRQNASSHLLAGGIPIWWKKRKQKKVDL